MTYVQFCKDLILPEVRPRDYASEGRFLEHFDRIAAQASSSSTSSSIAPGPRLPMSPTGHWGRGPTSNQVDSCSILWKRAYSDSEDENDEGDDFDDDDEANTFEFEVDPKGKGKDDEYEDEEDEDRQQKLGEGERERRTGAEGGSITESEQQPPWPAAHFCFYERDSPGDCHRRYDFVLRICVALADVSLEKLQNSIWTIQRVLIHDAMGVGRPNPRKKGVRTKGDLSPLVLQRGKAFKALLKQHRTKLRMLEREARKRNAKNLAANVPSITQKGQKMCTKCRQPWRRYHVCT